MEDEGGGSISAHAFSDGGKIYLGLVLDPVGTRPPEPEQPKPYESIFNTSP